MNKDKPRESVVRYGILQHGSLGGDILTWLFGRSQTVSKVIPPTIKIPSGQVKTCYAVRPPSDVGLVREWLEPVIAFFSGKVPLVISKP